MQVLLVSPRFHGYHQAIAAALEARGHSVTTHVYDGEFGRAGRVWHQVRHELPRRVGAGSHRGLTAEQTDRAVDAVRTARPDAVVVVKGDTLGEPFWEAIAGRPRVTWLYDEIRRTRWSVDRLRTIGPLATYSGLDAADLATAGIAATYLPLAFDHRLIEPTHAAVDQRITFVGARYPSRAAVLETLHDAGLPVTAYGRDWSSHPIDRLRTWRISTPIVPSGRDLGRADAYQVMADSAGTLNLHGDQDGFTMRTFEAAGVGGVQLIDRTDVAGLYDPEAEVLAWTELEELIDLCRRAVDDPTWAATIRHAARARTLAEHTFDHRVAVLEDLWDTV